MKKVFILMILAVSPSTVFGMQKRLRRCDKGILCCCVNDMQEEYPNDELWQDSYEQAFCAYTGLAVSTGFIVYSAIRYSGFLNAYGTQLLGTWEPSALCECATGVLVALSECHHVCDDSTDHSCVCGCLKNHVYLIAPATYMVLFGKSKQHIE